MCRPVKVSVDLPTGCISFNKTITPPHGPQDNLVWPLWPQLRINSPGRNELDVSNRGRVSYEKCPLQHAKKRTHVPRISSRKVALPAVPCVIGSKPIAARMRSGTHWFHSTLNFSAPRTAHMPTLITPLQKWCTLPRPVEVPIPKSQQATRPLTLRGALDLLEGHTRDPS